MLRLAALLPFVAVAPGHWSFELHGGIGDVHSGKRALHIVMESGAATETAHQPFSIRPEQPLSATVWHKGDASEVRLLLRFLDAQGRIISTALGEPSRTDLHWGKLAIAARSPSAAERMSLVHQVTSVGHATFDDVSLNLKTRPCATEAQKREFLTRQKEVSGGWLLIPSGSHSGKPAR